MQLARILLVLTALAVIDTEARWFSLPITFPASFSSLLPFTFNVTKDDSDLGSVTLNIKPKFTREIAGAKVKREVTAETAEKMGRLNSKESRLFRPLTEKWEMGLPSGLGLTLGAVGSVAGVIWTVIAKNLEYKKEHGELDWKDSKGNAPIPAPPSPPAPSYGSYNAPSYSSDYSIPPHQKPEKGFDGFLKGGKGIKEMQAQAMKGLTRLVGLRDLDSLLHPKPKKLKKKKRPMQQQYYAQPVYQSSYTYPQEYAPQPSYDPAPAYAPAPAYDPAPAYAPPPAYDPAPANTPPPAELPAYAPPPQDSAPTPQSAPVYAPAPEPAPVPPPVPAQVDVLPPPYAPPAQYFPTNNFPAPMFSSPHAPRKIEDSPTQTAQQWNGPSVSSSQSDSLPPQISDSAPVDDSTPQVSPPTYISIQTNGFLPIFPSPVDPMPFEPSPDNSQTPQIPEPTGNVPTFGVEPSPTPSAPSPLLPLPSAPSPPLPLPPPSAPSPPLPPPSAPSSPLPSPPVPAPYLPPPSAPSPPRLPPRGSRLEDSQPLEESLPVTEDSSSQTTATAATSPVVTTNAAEEFELDEEGGPQYSIMEESIPTDTSVTNSSIPYGTRLSSVHRTATL